MRSGKVPNGVLGGKGGAGLPRSEAAGAALRLAI